MKKKIIIIISASVLFLAAVGGTFLFKAFQNIKDIQQTHSSLKPLSLSAVNDGVYSGSYGGVPVSVELDVTVKDHAITSVVIKKQNCGKGYEAKETAGRILAGQSPLVDAVSGATISSKCIMIAAHRALAGL